MVSVDKLPLVDSGVEEPAVEEFLLDKPMVVSGVEELVVGDSADVRSAFEELTISVELVFDIALLVMLFICASVVYEFTLAVFDDEWKVVG